VVTCPPVRHEILKKISNGAVIAAFTSSAARNRGREGSAG
jgi:hypothetical protein